MVVSAQQRQKALLLQAFAVAGRNAGLVLDGSTWMAGSSPAMTRLRRISLEPRAFLELTVTMIRCELACG
jgi:hypothetical protein